MHLLPYNFKHVTDIIHNSKMQFITEMKAIKDYAGFPYVYFKDWNNNNYITVNEFLPRQYMRRLLASEVGEPDKWDWRQHEFIDNVKETIKTYQHVMES